MVVGVWACGRVGVWACGRVGVWGSEGEKGGARMPALYDEGPPRNGTALRVKRVRQLLPRRIAIMRRISTYSHTTVTMMPKAPTQP